LAWAGSYRLTARFAIRTGFHLPAERERARALNHAGHFPAVEASVEPANSPLKGQAGHGA